MNRQVIRPLANWVPARFGNFSFDFKLKQFLRGTKCCESQRLWCWLGLFVMEELPLLLDTGCLRETLDALLYVDVERHFERVAHRDQISRDGY